MSFRNDPISVFAVPIPPKAVRLYYITYVKALESRSQLAMLHLHIFFSTEQTKPQLVLRKLNE